MHYSTCRHRRSNHNFRNLVLLVLIIAGGIYVYSHPQNFGLGASISAAEIPETPSIADSFWWNPDYPYRRQIEVNNNVGQIASVQINHTQMVNDGLSRADGQDLQVVAQIGNKTEALIAEYSGLNTPNAVVKVDTTKYPTADYYLYYGNKAANQILGSSKISGSASAAALSAQQTPQLGLSSNKLWVVKQESDTQLELNISYAIKPETVWVYQQAAEPLLIEELQMSTQTDGKLKVDGSKLSTGNVKLFAVARGDGGLMRSNNVALNVSYPMYVIWSIDWEGRNIQDWVLAAVDELANKYSLPITHFFNPRIYVASEISESRRRDLTNWVRSRQLLHQDEIAMHMHMYFDMVSAAGVTPKHTPSWGSGVDGYDVLNSTYSYDEFTKVLTWGLKQFEQHGLPRPAGYRAGGWFADLDILRAINDSGFAYDSSGREPYSFGKQNQKGEWQLSKTTQPYKPSTADINSPDPQPTFQLWEVPNNGNDSYWFNYEDLVDRFYANFAPAKTLTTPVTLTYLSHLDWYDVDKPKMEKLLAEVNKYTLQADNGPVIFATISQVLQELEANGN